ncbi:hypothetical protein [Alicyclobacillus sp. SO9]|uniref:hypothetical protein n=1 Tax=Alicyclobacillus sp. SO9 TaxID=2665646 RepID=UPI0018E81495|nr:hypothetical protein [Alicyclobacillus sp. SO9]QQE76842.1 hypothetical protein GI364_12545 [Alicyclobacillus sp. SO9]
MATKVEDIFVLSVEEPGDYVFEPSGVVVLYSNKKFQLYSTSANHNRFRAALNRFSWTELTKGVVWKDAEYRITPVEDSVKQTDWEDPQQVPAVLQRLYNMNPKYLFFLERHL